MNIDVKVEGLNEVIAYIHNIEKQLSPSKMQKLNKKRAEAFRKFTIKAVREGKLGLQDLSEATMRIKSYQGKSSNIPMYEEGDFVKAMSTQKGENSSVEVGYFAGGTKTKNKKKNVEYAYLAMLHHATGGYRIPVDISSAKGKASRNWLSGKGINISASKSFIHVSPRPFLYKSIEAFVQGKEDDKIIKQFLESL